MTAPVAVPSRWWHPPLLAVQFLTRVPVPVVNTLPAEVVRTGLARSAAWFPAVGGAVGVATAGVLLAADTAWPRVVAVLLALLVEARLTGAFHEDAVADFCDAFGGARDRARTLEILADSRVGSYGALGLLLAVGLRAALLTGLSPALLAPALVASTATGRLGAVVLMAALPPVARPGSLAKDVAQRARPRDLLLGVALTAPFLAPLAVLAPGRTVLGLLLAAAALLWLGALLRRRLGGTTGDCLGTGVYAVQLGVLLGAAAAP